ncbi:MAG: PEGA domain-containing protein [Myxococcaceae bacterium]|nr:PEGA domain-containing protein [Myxococcaceae bacterium]
MRSFAWAVLVVFSCSTVAFAQDDDELAPLTKTPAKPKPAAKPKPKPKPAPVKPTQVDDDDLAPLVAAKGDVTIKLPQGLSNATVSIDGKDVGTFPVPPQSLAVGEHTVKVKRLGYADFVKKISVAAGKAVDVEARLTAVTAVLSVTSDVAGAQVFLNGRLVGPAPITNLEVAAIPTEIAVRKEGFLDDTQKLNLVAGKDYPVVVKFKPGATSTVAAVTDRPVDPVLTPTEPTTGVTAPIVETPLYARWYFWAGIAVVAVATAVTVFLLTRDMTPMLIQQTPTGVCGTDGCDLWLRTGAVQSALSMASAGVLRW